MNAKQDHGQDFGFIADVGNVVIDSFSVEDQYEAHKSLKQYLPENLASGSPFHLFRSRRALHALENRSTSSTSAIVIKHR